MDLYAADGHHRKHGSGLKQIGGAGFYKAHYEQQKDPFLFMRIRFYQHHWEHYHDKKIHPQEIHIPTSKLHYKSRLFPQHDPDIRRYSSFERGHQPKVLS